MKIALFTHNYPVSKFDRQNAGIFVYDFAHALKKQKQEVTVLCPDQSGEKIKEEIPVMWFKWPGGARKFGNLKPTNPRDLFLFVLLIFYWLRAADKFYKKYQPDHILGMWSFPSGIFTYWLRIRYRVPYSLWSLGSDIYVYGRLPILRQILRQVLRAADALFADGLELANEVKKLSGKKCKFIPSASNFVSKKRMKKSNKKTILTFVGRMESAKGPDLLIEALIKLDNETKNFQVNILGGGSLLEPLKQKVEEDGFSESIKFFGNVDDKKKIAQEIVNADWVVIPSRSDSIPLVFSEAMKNNTPVIVSSLPDLKYLVKKYSVGLTFTSGDIMALSKLLASLPNKKAKQTYERNTKKVAEIFDINVSAKRILGLINGQ